MIHHHAHDRARRPAIDYRTPPSELRAGELVAELVWLGDAATWTGPLGDYARARAASLRAELRRREGHPR